MLSPCLASSFSRDCDAWGRRPNPAHAFEELVYADDICLMASSPEQLQALVVALAAYCATLHMEISVPKTKVMVVSVARIPHTLFTRNGNSVEPVATSKYLGLHFDQSGALSHLIQPIKAALGRL